VIFVDSSDASAVFLAWISFGGLIGAWITSRKGLVAVIALAVSFGGTAVTLSPTLNPYWWIVIVLAVAIVVSRPDWRDRFITSGSVLYRLLFESEPFYERRLERIIRNLALSHKRAYRIVKDSTSILIDQSGTGQSVRTLEIAAMTEPISWLDLGFGVVNSRAGHRVRIDDPQITDENGNVLDYALYEDTPRNRRLLVFLREPVQVQGPSQSLTIRRSARGAWGNLVEDLEDYGTYQPQNEVDALEYIITVPTTLQIQDLRVSPEIGTATVSSDGHSATWVALSPQVGSTYSYIVKCLRAT
jgi:hypothetical protein